MAGSGKHLEKNTGRLPDGTRYRIGIVVAEWHPDITEALYEGACSALREAGLPPDAILRINVPGSFELIAGARALAEHEKVHAVICLGCLIRGETPHFDFIGHAVAQGLAHLSARFSLPFLFGVLTTNDKPQAEARAGGKEGNKGRETALAALKMAGLKSQFPGNRPIGF